MAEPTRFPTVESVLTWLESIPKFSEVGVKAADFGLDRMIDFCRRMGDPHLKIPAIHVAGTNGKGTTSQMLASMFSSAGYKTGLYTSPHLLRYNDRVRVDGVAIPDDEIHRFAMELETAFEEIPLSYFEISTCLAFWYFARQSCDVAIYETGLGGRLDATNVVQPLVSVITSVSLDHSDVLGETLPEIAAEKAGIIKEGRPVVAGNLSHEALSVVEKTVADRGARLWRAGDLSPEWRDRHVELTVPETRQKLVISGRNRKQVDRWNIASVYLVSRILTDRYPNLPEVWQRGGEMVDERFPDHAHFQRLHPYRHWYFDGAHNPEAMQTLMREVSDLEKQLKMEPLFILSFMNDKLAEQLLENFHPYRYVYYIEGRTERHASCDQVREGIPQAKCIEDGVPDLAGMMGECKTELVIFAGSLYFYKQVKHWMASQPPSDNYHHPELRL